MRFLFTFILLFFGLVVFSQDKGKANKPKSLVKTAAERAKELAKKAPVTSYKIISVQHDTIVLDTTLSIKKEYDYNYLRKDNFGLMPFPNEGQTYTTLNYGLTKFSPFPEFGFKAKHFGYLEVNDVKYYSVATPLTELYFKTVMEQGQNVDALITINTSKNFNFSVAFKGLRSLGKYINQLSSSGNFRFTTSYHTTDKRYNMNFHYTGQDILNGENGGLTQPENFEDKDPLYKNRPRLQVYFNDAKSFLKGKRFFIDHSFRVNPNDADHNLIMVHQLNYEHKFFEYNQATLGSTTGTTGATFQRFGTSSVKSNIIDQTMYDRLYNKLGAQYENKVLGKFQFFIENFIYNYFIGDEKTVITKVYGVTNTSTYSGQTKATINTVGGQYEYRKGKWNGKATLSNSISTQPMRNLDANLTYLLDSKNTISFEYQNMSKLPNHNYIVNNSSYDKYNWNNNFKNEKINNLAVNATTPWLKASLQLTTLTDHLYFSNDTISNKQYISPKQYSGTVNYLSLKVAREFKYRKWGLDNTFLYQKVVQKDTILNIPQLTIRNTIYFSDEVFKKAMFLQTGIILNYFSKYYADDYNPILGEFFVQKNQKIGNFPMLDFFINARIKQTRVFLKAEHFNSSFSGNKYYSAPNLPYHDFMIRFGLVWNFFQ